MKRIRNTVTTMNYVFLLVALAIVAAADEIETVTSNDRTGENTSEVQTELASEKEATTEHEIPKTSTEETDARKFSENPEKNNLEAEESIEKPIERRAESTPNLNQTEKSAGTESKTEGNAELRSANKLAEAVPSQTERSAEEELNGIERTTERTIAEEPKETEVSETKTANKNQNESDTRSSNSEISENKSGKASESSSAASSDASSKSSKSDNSANVDRLAPNEMSNNVLKKLMSASFQPVLPDMAKNMFPENLGFSPPIGAKPNDMGLFNMGSRKNWPEYIAPPQPQRRLPYPPLTPEPTFYHQHAFQPPLPPRPLGSGEHVMPYKSFIDSRPINFEHDLNSNSYPYSPIESFQKPNYYPPKQYFDPNIGFLKPSRRVEGNQLIPPSFYEATPGFPKPARGPESNHVMPPTFYDPNQNFPRPSPPMAMHNNYGPKQPLSYNDNFRNRRHADEPTNYRGLYTTLEPTHKPNYFGFNFSPKPYYEQNNGFPQPMRSFDSNQLIPPTPVYNDYGSMKPPTYNGNFRTRRHAEELSHSASAFFRRKYPYGTF